MDKKLHEWLRFIGRTHYYRVKLKCISSNSYEIVALLYSFILIKCVRDFNERQMQHFPFSVSLHYIVADNDIDEHFTGLMDIFNVRTHSILNFTLTLIWPFITRSNYLSQRFNHDVRPHQCIFNK